IMRVQAAPTVPARREALQQGRALSHRPSWLMRLGVEVRVDAHLIGFVRGPVDEALMVVGEKDRPFGARQAADPLLDGPVRIDVPLAAAASIYVGASIYRIAEHMVHGRVGRRPPPDALDAVGL